MSNQELFDKITNAIKKEQHGNYSNELAKLLQSENISNAFDLRDGNGDPLTIIVLKAEISAAQKRQYLRQLFDAGLDVNAKDENNHTAMDYIIGLDYKSLGFDEVIKSKKLQGCAQFLFARGAEFNNDVKKKAVQSSPALVEEEHITRLLKYKELFKNVFDFFIKKINEKEAKNTYLYSIKNKIKAKIKSAYPNTAFNIDYNSVFIEHPGRTGFFVNPISGHRVLEDYLDFFNKMPGLNYPLDKFKLSESIKRHIQKIEKHTNNKPTNFFELADSVYCFDRAHLLGILLAIDPEYYLKEILKRKEFKEIHKKLSKLNYDKTFSLTSTFEVLTYEDIDKLTDEQLNCFDFEKEFEKFGVSIDIKKYRLPSRVRWDQRKQDAWLGLQVLLGLAAIVAIGFAVKAGSSYLFGASPEINVAEAASKLINAESIGYAVNSSVEMI